MATNQTVVDVCCDVCTVQSITKIAVKWCPECQEAFCDECLKFHYSSKNTKDHVAIEVDDFKKLPSYVLEMSRFCSEHDAPYQNFCMDHDQPCCSKCIDTKHKGCKELPALDDVIKGAANSAALSDVEARLQFLKDFFVNLHKENQMNINQTKDECFAIRTHIKSIRQTLNEHLDLLEDTINEQLSISRQTSQKELDEISEIILEKDRTICETIDNIKTMKQYASELQIFLGTKVCEQQIRKEEENIEVMLEQGKFDMQRITLKQNSQVESLLAEFKSFGEINVESEKPKTILVKPKNLQAPAAASKQYFWSFNIFNKK